MATSPGGVSVTSGRDVFTDVTGVSSGFCVNSRGKTGVGLFEGAMLIRFFMGL